MKKQNPKLGQLIRLSWEDSTASFGWKDGAAETGAPVVIESVGFVVKNTERAVTITGHVGDNGDVNTTMSIPWGCIKEFREVGDGKRGTAS